MNVNDFISNVEKEFDDIPLGTIKPQSKFKEVLDWNSINSVVFTTMIEFEYQVILTPDDFKRVDSVEELVQLIALKAKN